MAPDGRDPLGSISLNTSSSSSTAAGPSRKPYIAPKDRPLASIFMSKRRTTPPSSSGPASSSPPVPTTPSSSHDSPDAPARKRARFSPPEWEGDVSMGDVDVDMGMGMDLPERQDVKVYFPPLTPTRPRVRAEPTPVAVETVKAPEVIAENVWVKPRRRMGVAAFRPSYAELDSMTPSHPTPAYLNTFTHSLRPFVPNTLPSSILLPSLHPPTGRPREHAPALCVQFSNSAKLHTASSAKEAGLKRLMAVAGEEGGMRIINVDAKQEYHRETGGWWWRAHANAIFDTKWSDDDTKIMTTSGDQTTRLHALDGSTPTLLATLRGHTSSVKTATFFDPSRSNAGTDASRGPIVATAGRDGNILIFDLRCNGWQSDADKVGAGDEYASRRSGRERDRYSAGIPGFSPKREGAELDPVMVIRGAHAESGSGRRSGPRSSSRSVTSIIALRAMPGMLASGGSADGIVKLWDLRFPTPTNRNPDPKPSHSASLFLPDPTTYGHPTSRRPRGIHSILESPLTGDLYVLAGDSKIHTLRPSYASPLPIPEETSASASSFYEGILPESYTSDDLRATSFFVRMGLSPDGRYLAAGSGKGGVVAFDTMAKGAKGANFELGESGDYWPEDRTREVSSVDWGNGCLAACADDRVTRIWRSSEGEKEGVVDEWGSVRGV